MNSTSPIKISFGYSGNQSPNRSPSPQPHSVFISDRGPPHSIQTSHVKHVEVVRSEINSSSPQQSKRVVVVDQPNSQNSPFKRIQTSVNKQEIADTIYEKLEGLNSKLQKIKELELQNVRLRQENQTLKENAHKSEEKEQESSEKNAINWEQKYNEIVDEKNKQIQSLQSQNEETQKRLQAFKTRFEQGRNIFVKILENEDLKDKEEIIEMKEIFDD